MGIAPCPIVPPFRFLIVHLRPGVSINSTKTTESEAFEKELALRRPVVSRIHPAANMRVAQVQSAAFAVISLADGGFMCAPSFRSAAIDAELSLNLGDGRGQAAAA